MNGGETGGSPISLPVDPPIPSVEFGNKRQALPWLAILAAALLHGAVLLWLIIDWSHPVVAQAPDVVPVKIVFAPPPPPPAPPPPPPPPAAAAPAPKPTAPLAYRESGPDQRTTAPPTAEEAAPDAAAPPPPAPDQPNPEPKPPAPPPEKPTPSPQEPASTEENTKPQPQKQVARLEPQKKEAQKSRAPHPTALRHLNVEPGERQERGDPYLNALHALIERHRVYPRIIGPFGLPVDGTAVYDVALDRSGKIIGMKLEQSSGVAGLDLAVENMIRSALPFPPLPPDYPDEVGIVVTIRLFPPS
ncbi:MAG TPA: TonB family protein [Stellaceae bacterium]|nr:TonB family protein [Stellaceae bacterium]